MPATEDAAKLALTEVLDDIASGSSEDNSSHGNSASATDIDGTGENSFIQESLVEQLKHLVKILNEGHKRSVRCVRQQVDAARSLESEAASLRKKLGNAGQQCPTAEVQTAHQATDGDSRSRSKFSVSIRKPDQGASHKMKRSSTVPAVTRVEVIPIIPAPKLAFEQDAAPGDPSSSQSYDSNETLFGKTAQSNQQAALNAARQRALMQSSPTPSGRSEPSTTILPFQFKDKSSSHLDIPMPSMDRPSYGRISRIGESIRSSGFVAGPMFTDTETMKEQVRQAIIKPVFREHNFYYESGWLQVIARSKCFEFTILMVIFLNSIWFAIDAEFNDVDVTSEASWYFQLGEHIFTFLYVFEWVVRFGALERKWDGLRDNWFVFDSVLALLMVLDTWVMTGIYAISGGDTSGTTGNAAIFRVLRLVRLLKMFRIVRLIRIMPELMILIKGILVAFRSVCITLLLLGIILYVFAIMFMQTTRGTTIRSPKFRTLGESIMTLLLEGVIPDQAPLVNYCRGDPVTATLTLVCILLCSLTVMNMLTGILVDVVHTVSLMDKEQMDVSYATQHIQSVYEQMQLQDNQISQSEFEQLLEQPSAVRVLQNMGVDVVGLVDLTEYLFKDSRKLSFSEFMEIVIQLRGTNTAKVKDIIDLRKLLVNELLELNKKITSAINKASVHSVAAVSF